MELVSHQRKEALVAALEVKPSTFEEIKVGQASDNELERIRPDIEKGKSPEILVHKDGTLTLQNCLCVPKQ